MHDDWGYSYFRKLQKNKMEYINESRNVNSNLDEVEDGCSKMDSSSSLLLCGDKHVRIVCLWNQKMCNQWWTGMECTNQKLNSIELVACIEISINIYVVYSRFIWIYMQKLRPDPQLYRHHLPSLGPVDHPWDHDQQKAAVHSLLYLNIT